MSIFLSTKMIKLKNIFLYSFSERCSEQSPIPIVDVNLDVHCFTFFLVGFENNHILRVHLTRDMMMPEDHMNLPPPPPPGLHPHPMQQGQQTMGQPMAQPPPITGPSSSKSSSSGSTVSLLICFNILWMIPC